MIAQPKTVVSPQPTGHLKEAFERLSKLSDERQDEIARMLLDIVANELSPLRLTLEQQAEVQASMSDDEPYATDAEVEALFAKYRV